ncbi:MAG TPA: HAMP domain-containing protein, partial [Gemmatimonadales bacterium]|nr:HAMP domain-containing protein [Gemmatimonadales bacterium]
MRWTIQRTLLAAAGISGLLLLGTGAISYQQSRQEEAVTSRLSVALAGLHDHLDAARMHQAIRSDVMRAFYVAQYDRPSRESVFDDLDDHVQTFQHVLAAADTLPLSDSIKVGLKSVADAMGKYLEAAEGIVPQAFDDPQAARSRIPALEAGFRDLEFRLDHVAGEFEREIRAQQATAVAVSRRAHLVIALFCLSAIVASLTLMLLLARRIVGDVREVLRASRSAGQGDLTARARVRSRNELGEAAEALNQAVEGMHTALGTDQVDWQEMGRQRAEIRRIRQIVENAPLNIMYADRDLVLQYLNPAAIASFRRLQAHLPVPVDEMIGQSIDVFHRQPAHARAILFDPAKLPHQSQIRLGPETLQLNLCGIREESGDTVGYMATWEIVTARLEAEQQVRDAQRAELDAAESKRRLEGENAARRQEEGARREAEQKARAEEERSRAEDIRLRVDKILAVVDAAGRGDLTQEVVADGDDAVGRLGDGLAAFFRNLRGSIAEIARTAETVGGASTQMNTVGGRLNAMAGETSAQATVVATAADEVSRNVQTVAAGAEEMSVSIREIARNAADAARVAAHAVQVAERANATVEKLGASSGEIGKV